LKDQCRQDKKDEEKLILAGLGMVGSIAEAVGSVAGGGAGGALGNLGSMFGDAKDKLTGMFETGKDLFK